MAKVSILVPIYNVEGYLDKCLDSIVNQTEQDIEIICVEDCSTDNSKSILKKYQEQDKRMKMICHEYNMGLCKSRKDAVLEATGEYILFVDSDDYINKDACEKLYEVMKEKNVDFIQFGTNIISDITDSQMLEWVDKFMTPSEVRIEDEKIIQACFIDGLFNCNLVNKIWKSDLCKKAYAYIDNGHYISSEDRYACFILAHFAKSCEGVKDKYYNYHVGVGVTGGEILDLSRFENRCKGAVVIGKIEEFIHNHHLEDIYQTEFEAFQNDILWDCIDSWYSKLEEKDYEKGYQILLKYWPADVVVGALARVYFEKQDDIFSKIFCTGKRNIMIYYRYMGYQPMDDILKRYINKYKNEKNNIILLTDQESMKESNTYLDERLEYIPDAKDANWDFYQNRAKAFAKLLKEHNVCEVCYLSVTSHVFELDKILVESMGIKLNFGLDEYLLDDLTKLELEHKQEMVDVSKRDEGTKKFGKVYFKRNSRLYKGIKKMITGE